MPEDLESIWEAISDEVRSATADFKYQIWLEPLRLAAVRGHTLYVRAPDRIRTSVVERYLPLLRRAAASRFHRDAVVEVVGEDWRPEEPAEPAARRPATAQLNPKYTFDQFVIGEGNRFAHAAALAVAELPAQAYNPLFLHGAPGLGKTHLLHAIGHYVSRFGSGLTVRYATVEEFTSAFVDAVRRRSTAAFKEGFRRADVVLIDDVQFLAERRRTREEFFHTFNALLESGRQLAITSDRSPEELPEVESRLAERFRSGLVAELEPPGEDARRTILHKRARLDELALEPAVLDEIAGLVTSSVRALEGALIRVVAYASLRSEPATPALARQVLRRLGDAPPRVPCDLGEILDAVATEFGVQPADLLARDRRPAVATARQVAMYLARELTEHTLPEIGRGVGGRNHATVVHAINRIGASLRTDMAVQNSVDNLRRRLGPRG